MKEAKSILHVGNAILTDECVKYLEYLQRDSDENLESVINLILKAIMYINLDPNNLDNPKTVKRKHELTSDLALLVEGLENLGVPPPTF